ncbi:sterol desaturase family protein [Aestuariispira insulae]|uniref:sterol desaturase family protein n=1 Tax=Aestuariispira insulae TaxID=1461337 RepID=UPI001FE7CDC5|nr:sterol desaturase family protein [Aestuariispira insulae]
MNDSAILQNEPVIRFGLFAGIFSVMAFLEACFPRRDRQISRKLRWTSNLGLILVNFLVIRLAFPLSLLWLAGDAALSGVGLFNQLDLPFWPVVVLSVILLDLAIYLQHLAFHYVPFLWRLHRMHHADLEIDVTTGLRFHPLEILLSLLLKAGLILLIGPPVLAVLMFEVILNGMAQFNHANFRLPLGIDRWLRLIVVTPDFHRVHHSVIQRETNSNFGFNLSIWDRLFRTYRPQPEAGHDDMEIGLEQFRTVSDLRLDRMLIQPFRRN